MSDQIGRRQSVDRPAKSMPAAPQPATFARNAMASAFSRTERDKMTGQCPGQPRACTTGAMILASRTAGKWFRMGSGSGCDGQYLFANDVLGYTQGHVPRHARIYRNFKAEFEKLQNERISAFKEFHSDTVNQTFNDPKITVGIEDKEYEEFLKLADKY